MSQLYESIINLLWYNTVLPIVNYSWVTRLCWTYEQTGLRKALSEQNSIVCRGPTGAVTDILAQRKSSLAFLDNMPTLMKLSA